MPNPPDLAQLLDDADFHSVSVVKSGEQWQANLQAVRGTNSFRVCHGSTAAEALRALFAPVPRDTIALPPCPVPLPA